MNYQYYIMSLKKIYNIDAITHNEQNKSNIYHEVGIDEAGRGPLLGRVYTAAVILPYDDDSIDFSSIKDSKKFTSEKKIQSVFEFIKNIAIDYSISYKDESDIDKYNILQATVQSMHDCIQKLNIIPNHIIVDGNYFKPYSYYDHDKEQLNTISHTCIKKGDASYYSIAAASILAKVSRDNYIKELCSKEPELNEYYHLLSNKGYGTKQHIQGIREHGYSKYHRKSFHLRHI